MRCASPLRPTRRIAKPDLPPRDFALRDHEKEPAMPQAKKTEAHPNSFKSRKTLKVGNKTYVYLA